MAQTAQLPRPVLASLGRLLARDDAWDYLCLRHDEGAVTIARVETPETILERLPCPLRLGALAAACHRHLQRATHQKNTCIRLGSWILDHAAQRLQCEARVIALTEKEVALLSVLHAEATACSRATLLARVWGYRADLDTHTLETHLYRLRRKLNGTDIRIDNQDDGYCLTYILHGRGV